MVSEADRRKMCLSNSLDCIIFFVIFVCTCIRTVVKVN